MAKKKAEPVPPSIEARNEVLAVIRRTADPLTANQISKSLVVPFKIAEPVLTPILDSFVAEKRLNAFPPATKTGKVRYWDRDSLEYVRNLIARSIMKKGPQPKSKLKTAAKGLDDVQFAQLFQGMIDSRILIEHPPIGKSKTVPYGIDPPSPEPYLKELGQQLTKIVERLIGAGTDRQQISKTFAAMLAHSGLSMESSAQSKVTTPLAATTELNLLLLMRQIEPGAERGALVTARELRRAANLDKDQFDQAILGLARLGRLMLHRHDHASGLSATERDELVTDGSGTYYVGMALRRTDA